MRGATKVASSAVRGVRGFLHEDSGMLSVSNSILVLGAVLLFVANWNMGMVTNRKVQVQTAADASARTAGIWMARGMNSITAANHLMGEMLSFVVLHEAVGGRKHEQNRSADNGVNRSKHGGGESMVASPDVLKRTDRQLQLAYIAADAMRPVLNFPPHRSVFELVHQRSGGRTGIHAEATLLDAKINLKVWLTRVYTGKATAGALILTGFYPLVVAGKALEAAMEPLELKIEQEYRTLKALDSAARSLLPMKKLLRDVLLPAAKRYTTAVVRSTPQAALQAARTVAEKNGATAELFPLPGQLKLPVQMDPLALAASLPSTDRRVPEPNPRGCGCPSERTAVSRDQIVKVTQLARATFPWVNYHRQPILDAMAATLQLADAKELYFHWTNGYSKSILDEQQRGRAADPNSHLGLYVLIGYQAPDKGYELWNLPEFSTLAEQLFSVVAMARMPAPGLAGNSIFLQEHPDGQFAWSMVMLYNGNQQLRPEHRIDLTCKRILPLRQAAVGWDTLNWKPGSLQKSQGCEERPSGLSDRENRPFELLGIGLPPQYPAIRVNWQIKLVPASADRLSQLRQAPLPQPFRRTLDRIPAKFPVELATH
jgi:hypothetical protein